MQVDRECFAAYGFAGAKEARLMVRAQAEAFLVMPCESYLLYAGADDAGDVVSWAIGKAGLHNEKLVDLQTELWRQPHEARLRVCVMLISYKSMLKASLVTCGSRHVLYRSARRIEVDVALPEQSVSFHLLPYGRDLTQTESSLSPARSSSTRRLINCPRV